jgi:cell division protein FtsB
MPSRARGEIFWRAPERVRRPRRARPWLGLGLVLAIVTYLLVFGEAGWLAVRAEQNAVGELTSELERIRAQTAAVQARDAALARPQSDELERVAREQYRMRREGEEVHHLVGGGDDEESRQREPRPRP